MLSDSDLLRKKSELEGDKEMGLIIDELLSFRSADKVGNNPPLRQPFTKRHRHLMTLWAGKMTTLEIAEKLGRTKGSVIAEAFKMNLSLRVKR